MKALKTILLILAAIVGLYLVLAFITPGKINVERSTIMNASPDAIFPHIINVKDMDDNWSPWKAKDPNMELSYRGEMGEIGSVSRWVGNPETTGTGEREVIAMEKNKSMTSKLTFEVPWESTSEGYFKLAEDDDGTLVTWGFNSETPFMMRPIMLLKNMDEMVGADFEEGLNKLKVIVEEEASSSTSKYDISELNMDKRTYFLVVDTVSFENMQSFFSESFGKVFGAIAASGIDMSTVGKPAGVYFYWDPENGKTYMGAGTTMPAGTELDGFEMVSAGGKALAIDYYGDYAGSEAPHMAMEEHMNANGLELNELVIEEYITDPAEEPDTTKWLTKIYYQIK